MLGHFYDLSFSLFGLQPSHVIRNTFMFKHRMNMNMGNMFLTRISSKLEVIFSKSITLIATLILLGLHVAL